MKDFRELEVWEKAHRLTLSVYRSTNMEKMPSAAGASAAMTARFDRVAPLILIGVWLVVVAVVGLGGDYPLNDDWVYAWSARHFASTGEMRILDWAAPSLVSHIAWGSGLIKLFGGSYVVLRAGTVGWAALGLLVFYAIGRRSGFSAGESLLLALAVGLSPWYVNLSFTYMTDVPWMVLMFAAMLVLLTGTRHVMALLGAGLLVGLASLSRQYAVVVLPALGLLVAHDARAEGPAGWRWRAGVRLVLFLLPCVLLFGGFTFWYARMHGATLANRMTWTDMAQVWPLRPIAHALIVWHYLGLWVLPFVAALALRGTLGREVTRRQAFICATALLVWVAFAPIATYTDSEPALGFNAARPATMPYLGNVVYLFGTGPLTLWHTFVAKTPFLHRTFGFGILLSALTVCGGVFAGIWVLRAVKRVSAMVLAPAGACVDGESAARARARLLLVAFAACYLGWHLATGKILFDRYVFVIMPVMIWLAIDAVGRRVALAPVSLAIFAVIAVFSIGATHEYLAWNAARDTAVRDLETRGVAAADIDGGFEINGPRRFASYVHETGLICGKGPNLWWGEGARYVLGFWPDISEPGCQAIARYPFWTWPLTGERAVYVLDCAANRAPVTEP